MRFPLRYRIAVITVLCLLPVVVVSSWGLVRLATQDLWQEAEADTVAFADTVRRATRHAMLTFDRPQVDAILQTVSRQRGVRSVRLYDDQGRYRLPGDRDAADLDLAGPACTACHVDPRRAQLRAGQCLHREGGILRLYAPVPSEPACAGPACHADGWGVLGVLEVEMDESHIERQIGSLTARAAVGAAAVLVAALLPLLLVFRWALQRPLAECLRLVRSVARGELGARSKIRRGDEWGELLGAFDGMVGALSGARGDLEALNRDLERQVAARTEDLQVALAAAEESDRMKTEFLAGISHELSTPLQSVIGYADLLLDGIEGELAPDQRRDVETIRRNGGTLLQLVEDLLELARLEGHRRILCVDRLRLEDVAEAVVEAGRRLAAGKPVEVALAVEPGCPAVRGEAAALRNIVFHLVENAVRVTEAGSVRLAVREGGDGWVEVEVADTGPGMEPEALKAALKGFAPKGGGGGVGIGLSLARRIAELHGGAVAVESAVGRGTRVTLRLPPAPPTEEGEPGLTDPGESLPSG